MDTEAKVKEVLDEIRPYIQMDGGDVEFVEMKDKVVYLRMMGACHGCPSALMTLKMGIERRIQQQVPEIEAVEAV
jgi:Fe-S cluster biogenesis protein NfuA